MASSRYTIQKSGSNDYGPCPCCGNNSRKVWGYLLTNGQASAVYYVHWTLSRVHDHGASFDLVIGKWGHGSTPEDRSIVALAYRIINGQPEFMVIDAAGRPIAKSGELSKRPLRRDEVIGTPLAKEAFAMVDAIWIGDDRITELSLQQH